MVEVTSKHIAGLVVFIALIVALIAFISKQPGGYIETTGGSTCAWRLEGDATSDRAISFECKCNSGAVKYNCKYSGNPDITCPPFWRDVFGFFNQVRETVAGECHSQNIYGFPL